MPKTICELQGGEGGLNKYKLGSNGINEEQNDLKRIIIQSRGKERIFLEDRESLHSLYLLRWEEGILKVYMIRWQRGDILKLQIYILLCTAHHQMERDWHPRVFIFTVNRTRFLFVLKIFLKIIYIYFSYLFMCYEILS